MRSPKFVDPRVSPLFTEISIVGHSLDLELVSVSCDFSVVYGVSIVDLICVGSLFGFELNEALWTGLMRAKAWCPTLASCSLYFPSLLSGPFFHRISRWGLSIDALFMLSCDVLHCFVLPWAVLYCCLDAFDDRLGVIWLWFVFLVMFDWLLCWLWFGFSASDAFFGMFGWLIVGDFFFFWGCSVELVPFWWWLILGCTVVFHVGCDLWFAVVILFLDVLFWDERLAFIFGCDDTRIQKNIWKKIVDERYDKSQKSGEIVNKIISGDRNLEGKHRWDWLIKISWSENCDRMMFSFSILGFFIFSIFFSKILATKYATCDILSVFALVPIIYSRL